MELKNAIWESRNFGLRTCEITFNKNEKFDNYLLINPEQQYDYIVVKIPAGNIKFVHQLEEIGFRYLENQLHITFESEEIKRINKKWLRLLNGSAYKKINDLESLERLITNVKTGMFDSDRVSLDPLLGSAISGIRYRNWIKDLFSEDNVNVYFITKYCKEAGFLITKQKQKDTIQYVLVGIFDEFKGYGKSFLIFYYILSLAYEKGIKIIEASFSSNNVEIISAAANLISFKVKEIHIVLRKLTNRISR